MKGVLIGCGFFADNHLHAWNELGVKLSAVCDLEGEKARATAARHGIARYYTDPEEMLRKERPEFVDIAAPVSAHRSLVELTAGHRIPTICQKPFATNLDDADAMISACRDAGVPLIVHENFRWQTPMLAVREALSARAIGAPFFGRISFRHDYNVYAVQPYLGEVERFAILDVGVHLLDLARFFFGEVSSIACVTQRANPRVRGEDSATMLLAHEGGAVCVVDASFFSHIAPNPFPQTTVEVDCYGGSIRLLADYKLNVSMAGRVITSDVQPPLSHWMERPWHGVQGSVRNFQRHCLNVFSGQENASTSGDDNRRTLQLALLAYEAAEQMQSLRVER